MTTIPVLLRGVAWPSISAATGCAVAVGGIGAVLARNPAGSMLLAGAFALLAAAAALTLDEPASAVVDVTPTGPAHRTAVRSCALCAPLAGGVVLVEATRLRHAPLPAAVLLLAVVGNVLVGFALACIARRRNSEPGAWAATAVVLTLGVLPQIGPIARRVHTFPGPAGTAGLSCTTWWSLAIAVSLLCIALATYRGRTSIRRSRPASRSAGNAVITYPGQSARPL